MTGIDTTYMGMAVEIGKPDGENLNYFKFCSAHRYHLQACRACGLLRYPPATACPWCADPESDWTPVEGKGTVYSYEEVTHAVQPAFKVVSPYLILLVELDVQRGKPTEHEGLRIIGNLTDEEGDFAGPDLTARVGIGTRVKMVFKDIAQGFSIPQWTPDDDSPQPDSPWRYPHRSATPL